MYAHYLQLQDKQTVCTLITFNYRTNKQCVRLLPTVTTQTSSVYAYYLQLQDKQTVCTPITYKYKTNKQFVCLLPTITGQTNSVYGYYLQFYNYNNNYTACSELAINLTANKQSGCPLSII